MENGLNPVVRDELRLAYFSPVIEEVLDLDVAPEYFRHLRNRITRLTRPE